MYHAPNLIDMKYYIDIGNTNIVIKYKLKDTINKKYIQTNEDGNVEHYLLAFKNELNSDIINKNNEVYISSVVDKLNVLIKQVIYSIFGVEPKFVHDYDLSRLFDKDCQLQDIADDIACDIVAILNKYGPNSILVDLGTLSKIMVIGKNGTIQGGAVLPGLHKMFTALCQNNNVRYYPKLSETYIGTDICQSLNIGIVNGTKKAIIGIINGIEKEYCNKMTKIITGGYSNIINDLDDFIYDHDLLFDGLEIIVNNYNPKQ